MSNRSIFFTAILNRILAVLLTFLLITGLCAISLLADESSGTSPESSSVEESSAEPEYDPSVPPVTKNTVVIYSLNYDQILLELNNDNNPVASPVVATKLVAMMCAYDILVTAGRDPASEQVTIDSKAVSGLGVAGLSTPKLNISSGSVYTAEDLFNGTLVSGAIDACNALAYHCAVQVLGGTMNDFIERMNKKAAEIGCEATTFTNSYGLDQIGMKSSALDVTRIAAAFYKYDYLFGLSDQSTARIDSSFNVQTKNYLLSERLMEGYLVTEAIGMAAGQKDEKGGYMLITAVEKEGLTYIIVVMNASGEIRDAETSQRSFAAGNAYDDMKKLIKYTLNSFGYMMLLDENEPISELHVNIGKEADYVRIIPAEKLELLLDTAMNRNNISNSIIYDEDRVYKGEVNGKTVNMIDAPVSQGDVVGYAVFMYEGKEIGRVDLVIGSSIDQSGYLTVANKISSFIFGDTMKTILKIIVAIVVLYFIFSFAMFINRTLKKNRVRMSDIDDDE